MARTEDRRPRGRLGALAACLSGLCALGGCAAGEVHDTFYLSQPRSVMVLPLRNESDQQLVQVTFEGILQAALVGGEVTNVLETLRGAMEETLVLKDYELIPAPAPLPHAPQNSEASEASAPAEPTVSYAEELLREADAVIDTTILHWTHSRGPSTQFRFHYRVEMRDPARDVILFDGDFQCELRPGAPGSRRAPVDTVLRRCIRRALDPLPPASARSHPDAMSLPPAR